MNSAFIARLFSITTALFAIGLGWLFVLGHTAFAAFFYNPHLTHRFVENVLKLPYKAYLQSAEIYSALQFFIATWGWGLIAVGVALFWYKKLPTKILYGFLVFIATTSFFYALCNYMENAWRFGQLIEHSLQIGTALFFLFFIKNNSLIKNTAGRDQLKIDRQKSLSTWTCQEERQSSKSHKPAFLRKAGRSWFRLLRNSLKGQSNKSITTNLHVGIKLAIALTFIGHGLFAIGYYPVPGYFIDMIIKVFHIGEDAARNLLKIVGWLDIVFAIVLLFFRGKYLKIALGYIILWGFLTALARIVANIYLGLGWESILPWVPAFLIRIPHFMIPIILYLSITPRPINQQSLYR